MYNAAARRAETLLTNRIKSSMFFGGSPDSLKTLFSVFSEALVNGENGREIKAFRHLNIRPNGREIKNPV